MRNNNSDKINNRPYKILQKKKKKRTIRIIRCNVICSLRSKRNIRASPVR